MGRDDPPTLKPGRPELSALCGATSGACCPGSEMLHCQNGGHRESNTNPRVLAQAQVARRVRIVR